VGFIRGSFTLIQLPFFRLATVGVLAAACLLGACGRKGPLDPPPGGWDLPRATPGMTPVSNRPAAPAPPEYDDAGRPIAPTGPKRRTPIDWLID
jgi:predicted small lipoprotein YifL